MSSVGHVYTDRAHQVNSFLLFRLKDIMLSIRYEIYGVRDEDREKPSENDNREGDIFCIKK